MSRPFCRKSFGGGARGGKWHRVAPYTCPPRGLAVMRRAQQLADPRPLVQSQQPLGGPCAGPAGQWRGPCAGPCAGPAAGGIPAGSVGLFHRGAPRVSRLFLVSKIPSLKRYRPRCAVSSQVYQLEDCRCRVKKLCQSGRLSAQGKQAATDWEIVGTEKSLLRQTGSLSTRNKLVLAVLNWKIAGTEKRGVQGKSSGS